jgi:hypothetical protein
MFLDLSLDAKEEVFDDILENEECSQKSIIKNSSDMLNGWYAGTILSFKDSGRTISKEALSEKEISFIGIHSVESAVNVVYGLLTKFTTIFHESQIRVVLDLLEFIAKARVPKELAGGFLILMIKYHFLP